MQDDYENPVDKIIRQAREAGEFDDLPGKGKPLRWEDETHVPETQRMANRILKNSGFTLDWIELGRELDAQAEEARRKLEIARQACAEGRQGEKDWQNAAQAYVDKIQELNRRLLSYNLRVPHPNFQKRPYVIDPQVKDG